MTVGDLRDYLSQFPDDTLVLLREDDAPLVLTPEQIETVPHITLDGLDYLRWLWNRRAP